MRSSRPSLRAAVQFGRPSILFVVFFPRIPILLGRASTSARGTSKVLGERQMALSSEVKNQGNRQFNRPLSYGC